MFLSHMRNQFEPHSGKENSHLSYCISKKDGWGQREQDEVEGIEIEKQKVTFCVT